MTMVKLKAGEEIYMVGDPGQYLYLLKSGKVKISRFSASNEMILEFLKPGEVFGELELLKGGDRETSAIAHQDCIICLVEKETFLMLLEKKPTLSLKLTKLIGLRMQRLEVRLTDLAFKSTDEQFNTLILYLAEGFGEETTDGIKIGIRLTQKNIANLIGCSRQTISEIITRLVSSSLISVRNKQIIIHEMDFFKESK
jgi:CRP-like cAMP-binding protein